MSSVGNVNFTGVKVNSTEFNPRKLAEKFLNEKELKTEMLNSMPKSVKFLDKMKTFQGEVPNILINAVGTGLVAPVFIKHNFMSKTDEDTRTYTAWRQPVSAILAILTQAGLVIPFNRVIDNMTNKGEFSDLKFNKTAFQDTNFLERQIKKENPKLSKDEIKKLAKEQQYKQLEDLVENLYKKGTITLKTKNGTVNLGADKIKELVEQASKDMLKKAGTNENELKTVKQIQDGIKNKKSLKELHHIAQKGIKDSNLIYEVAQKHITNIANNIKGEKQFKGLLVSLAILPVTCSLLNWVYPKFMKIAFPNLADKKQKPKSEDTFVKSDASPSKKGGA